MKTLALLSGGKDSFLSAQIAMEQGYDVKAALTVIPEEFSMMFHYPNAAKAEMVASLLGVPWDTIKEEDFKSAIAQYVNMGFKAITVGAIASEYQKTRVERLCTELGIMSFIPLWRKEQKLILKELQLRGIKAMIVSVSAEGFGPEDLGRTIDQGYIAELDEKNRKYGINVSGEGGEYESYVLAARGMGELEVTESEKIWEGSHGYMLLKDVRKKQQ